MDKFLEFLRKVLPILLDRSAERLDHELELGSIKVYWCGDVLRIDIKPAPKDEIG